MSKPTRNGSVPLWLTAVICFSGLTVAASAHGSEVRNVPASTYYVATDGDDSFAGTLPATNKQGTNGPFRTLTRAQQAVRFAKGSVQGPITVEIRGGTYFLAAPLTFSSDDSGSASQEITWEGYPGDTQPVISSGQLLTGWRSLPGNLWMLTLPASFQNFEALYYDDVRRFRPVTTSTYLTLNPVLVSAPQTNCDEPWGSEYRCSDRFFYQPGNLAASYHDLSDVEIVSFEDWTVSRMRLKSVNPSQHIAYLTGNVQTGIYYGFLSGHRYLVQNVEEQLTTPGQWYLDRATSSWTLYYLANPGENPNRDTVIVPQQPQVLVASGLQYVTFAHVTFSHDNYTIPPQGHAGLAGETGVPAAVSFNSCSNLVLNGVTIDHTQGWGLEFEGTAVAGQGNTVTASLLYDLGTGGVRLGQLSGRTDTDSNVAQYNNINNSMIFSGGRFLPGGEDTAIWIGSSHHNTLANNAIYDFYTGAIELGASPRGKTTFTHDNLIEYNLLYNLGLGVTSDMGCIHAASADNTGNQIVNNVCHDVTNDQSPVGYGGNGIYLDTSTQNVLVKNNLVYRLSDTAFFGNDSSDSNTVTNNIFAYGRVGMLRRGTTGGAGSFTATNNIYYYDIGALQTLPSNWSCGNYCTQQFTMDRNTYWVSTGAPTEFVTTVPGNPNEVDETYDLAGWQAAENEDLHSQNADPGFKDPVYPSDDYTFAGSPPPGFVPFSTDGVGPTVPLNPPPSPVPEAFPLQLLDPLTGF